MRAAPGRAGPGSEPGSGGTMLWDPCLPLGGSASLGVSDTIDQNRIDVLGPLHLFDIKPFCRAKGCVNRKTGSNLGSGGIFLLRHYAHADLILCHYLTFLYPLLFIPIHCQFLCITFMFTFFSGGSLGRKGRGCYLKGGVKTREKQWLTTCTPLSTASSSSQTPC